MTSCGVLAFGALAAASALLLVGCTSEPQVASAPAPTTYVDGLDAPWSMVLYGDTLLVSERDTARIVESDMGGTTHEVATIEGVRAGGEGGLLGLAIRGDELYMYFTAGDGNRVERRPILGDPGALSLGEPAVIIDKIPAASNHNGGRIAFGPDGMLYITTGDAGQRDSAQRRRLSVGEDSSPHP